MILPKPVLTVDRESGAFYLRLRKGLKVGRTTTEVFGPRPVLVDVSARGEQLIGIEQYSGPLDLNTIARVLVDWGESPTLLQRMLIELK